MRVKRFLAALAAVCVHAAMASGGGAREQILDDTSSGDAPIPFCDARTPKLPEQRLNQISEFISKSPFAGVPVSRDPGYVAILWQEIFAFWQNGGVGDLLGQSVQEWQRKCDWRRAIMDNLTGYLAYLNCYYCDPSTIDFFRDQDSRRAFANDYVHLLYAIYQFMRDNNLDPGNFLNDFADDSNPNLRWRKKFDVMKEWLLPPQQRTGPLLLPSAADGDEMAVKMSRREIESQIRTINSQISQWERMRITRQREYERADDYNTYQTLKPGGSGNGIRSANVISRLQAVQQCDTQINTLQSKLNQLENRLARLDAGEEDRPSALKRLFASKEYATPPKPPSNTNYYVAPAGAGWWSNSRQFQGRMAPQGASRTAASAGGDMLEDDSDDRPPMPYRYPNTPVLHDQLLDAIASYIANDPLFAGLPSSRDPGDIGRYWQTMFEVYIRRNSGNCNDGEWRRSVMDIKANLLDNLAYLNKWYSDPANREYFRYGANRKTFANNYLHMLNAIHVHYIAADELLDEKDFLADFKKEGNKDLRWRGKFDVMRNWLLPKAIRTGPLLAPGAETSLPAQSPQTTRDRFCTECGAKTSAGAKFCASCGHKL